MKQGADFTIHEGDARASAGDASVRVDSDENGRLRVAVVTTFYPPCNFGGDGIYIRNLVHSLAGADVTSR